VQRICLAGLSTVRVTIVIGNNVALSKKGFVVTIRLLARSGSMSSGVAGSTRIQIGHM
jgi:hypothetical protein